MVTLFMMDLFLFSVGGTTKHYYRNHPAKPESVRGVCHRGNPMLVMESCRQYRQSSFVASRHILSDQAWKRLLHAGLSRRLMTYFQNCHHFLSDDEFQPVEIRVVLPIPELSGHGVGVRLNDRADRCNDVTNPRFMLVGWSSCSVLRVVILNGCEGSGL